MRGRCRVGRFTGSVTAVIPADPYVRSIMPSVSSLNSQPPQSASYSE
jgi:hypothetical protein